MRYMEVPRPTSGALCSDPACPCSETPIPHGTGFIYTSEEVVKFRADALSAADAQAKIRRMAGGSPVIVGGGVISPILMCEQGAKLRELDLDIAAADARHWWQTGTVPCRATPKGRKVQCTKCHRPLALKDRNSIGANILARAGMLGSVEDSWDGACCRKCRFVFCSSCLLPNKDGRPQCFKCFDEMGPVVRSSLPDDPVLWPKDEISTAGKIGCWAFGLGLLALVGWGALWCVRN